MPLNLPRISWWSLCWCCLTPALPLAGQPAPASLVADAPALPPPRMVDQAPRPAPGAGQIPQVSQEKLLCPMPGLITEQRLAQLSLAAEYGDVALLREAYAAVDKLPPEEKFSPAPLRLAVVANEQETVRALLELGFDPNALSYRRLPLQFAINEGHAEIVEILLEQGANPNAEVTFGDPLMLQALLRGHWRIAQTLLIAGARTEIPPLHLAAGLGNRATVLERLESHPEELDEPWGERRSTPLEFAVRNGHFLIAKTLLDRGASAAGAENIPQDLVLLAARHGHEQVVELLLDYGAEGDFFEIARAAGPWHPEVFQVLYERGMRLPENQAVSTQLLNAAVSDGQLETVRLLLRWGVPAQALDRRGFTPLMCVFINPDREIFAELLGSIRGHQLNFGDPAFLASVMELYQRQASPLTRYGLGWQDLPVKLADEEARLTQDRGIIVATLRNLGLPLDFQDAAGRTLLWSAVAQGYPEDALQLLSMGAAPNLAPDGALGPLGLSLVLPNRSPAKTPLVLGLLQAGADPAPPKAEEVASLEFVALQNACPEAAELLRQFQEDPQNLLTPEELKQLKDFVLVREDLKVYLHRHGYLTPEAEPAEKEVPDEQS